MDESRRKKESISVQIEREEDDVDTRAEKHEIRKVKKRKLKKVDDHNSKNHDIENKSKKKKRKDNIHGLEISIKIPKERKSKTFCSEVDCQDKTHDENARLKHYNGDSTETAREKHCVKSHKTKTGRNQSDEELTDEVLVKKKKKEKTKKNKTKTPTTKDTQTANVTKKKSADEALMYLKAWKKDRPNWTFKKVRQVWLLRHMFDRSMVPDKYFKILLLYLEGLEGNAKKTTISRAEAIIESDNDQKEPEGCDMERVKKLLQILT